MSKNIIALGTGAADTTKYYQTAFLLTENDQNMLIDTGGGSGLIAQFDKAGVSVSDIQSVFITHHHIDHIFGIFWLLRFRGSKIAKGKAPDLTIYASEKNIALIKEISFKFLKPKVTDIFDEKIIFIPVNSLSNETIGNWKATFISCQSEKDEQFGVKIVFSDSSNLVFLGDEPYKESMNKICENADYLFHDSFCLENDRERFKPEKIHHSTVSEAAKNAQKLNAKNLILFHTEDSSTFGKRKELYTEEAKQLFSGNILVPDDLEKIEL